MPRLPVDVAYHGYAGGVGGFIPPGAFKLPNHTPRPYPAGTVIGRVTGGFQGVDAQGHDAALPAVVETRGTAPVIHACLKPWETRAKNPSSLRAEVAADQRTYPRDAINSGWRANPIRA